ncbi:pimeloyl-ACP methyl ester carboxylesterase [Mycoplana sp. BE70]|uniref:alpha/beta fold hydrolase n=1 Tax=Mycoplana sp. BE70 TaxID=2817775 RepID=UPI00285AAD1F|nr:alpha/beta hydrolase [Mycoplana sp. BE70]MDR6757287.1 pimeloyl-ACP methyl ester carboxylesterase [Mycoplana sp. BE70]
MTLDRDSAFEQCWFPARDGLMLHARDYRRDAPGIPVICLPGLSRNARDFHQFASMISAQKEKPRRVLALDYRGRGRSDWDENKANYNLAVECEDVLTAMQVFDIARAIFIGTSRGGLILHLLAASRPELLEAVILNDIGPAIEAEGLREIATYLGRHSEPKDWNDAASILRATHGSTFPALTETDWHDMAVAIYAEKDGRLTSDFDPAIAAQLRALDLSQPLPELWPQFDAFTAKPLLAIRGEHSRLLSEATLREMARRHPAIRRCTARGQGHAPLLHKPDAFAAIADFLDTI